MPDSPSSPQPDEAAFWDERYHSGRMPWEFNGVPADARQFIRTTAPGRVLIPGCGSGHDVAAFAAAGWDVVGIELSQGAIDCARGVIGSRADLIRRGDFFREPLPLPFDVVYERAFLCAISPDLWPAYAERVCAVLRDGGRLIGYFFHGQDDEPPPYPIDSATAATLFGPRLVLEDDRSVTDSLPVYGGAERWQIWRKR